MGRNTGTAEEKRVSILYLDRHTHAHTSTSTRISQTTGGRKTAGSQLLDGGYAYTYTY